MKIIRILILTLAASFSFFAAFAKASMFGGAILIFLNSLSFKSIHLYQNSPLIVVLDILYINGYFWLCARYSWVDHILLVYHLYWQRRSIYKSDDGLINNIQNWQIVAKLFFHRLTSKNIVYFSCNFLLLLK